ncbi:sensor histidine kinase [Leucobacter chinensis]|uniref:sensor histidine kinase n=1 Tax=Leucobacter chinensis TaxID=2851010 RepID=UPI001C24628E|nr:histidine kinase [Leucobacter chinensis]
MQHVTRTAPPDAPRPPGVVRRWFAAHPGVIDWTITICYLLGSALMLVVGATVDVRTGMRVPLPLVVIFHVLSTAVISYFLVNRRKMHFVGFVVVAAICFLQPGNSAQIVADSTAMFFLLYAVPVYGSVRLGWIAFAVGAVLNTVNSYLWRFIEDSVALEVASTGSSIVFMLIIVLIGINIGNRRRYVEALVDRADMLERDRDQLARIAVAEERERIAREMHDIVAHSLSVMIALSEGASRSVERAPAKASDAMQRSAETGRTALSEMRRLLGVLKGQSAEAQVDFAPQPGVGHLPNLIENFRQAGLELKTQTTGQPPSDSGFGLAVYRIVQEALTNTLRYAGIGAKVDVVITYAPNLTTITVRDYGRVASGSRSMDNLGSGNGLVGLAERARMFGGEVRAGAHPEGGWIVIATLPMSGVT